MEFIWLTDIHLNFIDQESRMCFYRKIAQKSGEGVLITGDIAEAPSISNILTEMVKAVAQPIYFILGNHDYYGGNIGHVRQEITQLTNEDNFLNWLPATGPQCLGEKVVLLGVDGWADGRYGKYANSQVSMNDSRLIADLFQSKMLSKSKLLEKMQSLADTDAQKLGASITDSLVQYHPRKIIILTHIPPFKEVCLYGERETSDDFLPFFASRATGEVILTAAEENPEVEFLVLCGHTHSKARLQPRNNLTVKVGRAEYTKPEIQEVIIP